MTTKVALGNLNFRRHDRHFPERELNLEDKEMSQKQRRTLVELIYSRISNPEEVEGRLSQLESYNFLDAQEAIDDFLFAPWK